jgi:lysophospholipase L1-like esterase
MKINHWFTRNGFLTHLRIATAGTFVSAAAAMVVVAVEPSSPDATADKYYVSLGDSLAVGDQPVGPGSSDVATDQGYTDQLLAIERVGNPLLKGAKFGCSGQTTQGLLRGTCPDSPSGKKNQLAEAVQFISTHKVAFITLDIGANDLTNCLHGTGDLSACLAPTFANLGEIIDQLRAAAGPDVPIIGMNYYSPFLAFWDFGDPQQATILTNFVVLPFNGALAAIYAAHGADVADVESAFSTTDYTDQVDLGGGLIVPLNVARVCQWTWMCTLGDVHPNEAGYGIIAVTFAGQL